MIPPSALRWAERQLNRPVRAVTPVLGGRTDSIYAVFCADGDAAVLRFLDPQLWGETGRLHVVSEATGWRLMSTGSLAVPHLIASDPTSAEAGGFANLSTWLPGQVRLDRLDRTAIEELARVAAEVHRTSVDVAARPRPFESWAPRPPTVPRWSARPTLWEAAIALVESPRPATPDVLLHRDFHVGNLLWDADRVSGVIDWAETSWGPAEVDVMHARTNLAILHDPGQAATFTAAYVRHGGVLDPDPDAARYWWVNDILGFLPDPAPIVSRLTRTRPRLTPTLVRRRLEDLLAATLPG